MGKVVKLEVAYPRAVAPCRGTQAALCSRSPEVSPLTPKLKEFIDRAIVPILVKKYLAELRGEKQIAEKTKSVASCQSMTDSPEAGVSR